jgi:hypothetical protein
VTNSKFPAAYRKGTFVAFYGSWNRAPAPQGGYNVVFQPMADGKASGNFVVFADGFAGAVKESGRAAHRPSGLAVGPDGSLYISDDQHGRIWRVTYHGNADAAKVAAAPAPKSAVASSESNFLRRDCIPTPVVTPRPSLRPPERPKIRSGLAIAFSTARLPMEPAADVMARMDIAARQEPISRAIHGSGVTAALRGSRRRSPWALPNPRKRAA